MREDVFKGLGGGANYFVYGKPGPPGVQRNSFYGRCFRDVEMSFAKQVTFPIRDHVTLIRFQANLYNIFNLTNLALLEFGSPETTILKVTTAGTHVINALFGLAPAADNGRVIEFFARIEF